MAPENDELLDELETPASEAEGEEEGGEDSPESDSDDPLEGREDLQKVLLDLYTDCCGEDRYPRMLEVKDVKQAENYWAGRQYDWWSESDKAWKLPTQAPAYGDMAVDEMPRFQFVTNIYQSSGLTVIGAGAGAPPRIRFFPEDPDDEDDIETAAGRTKLSKLIERWNPPQKRLQDEYYHAYTGGFIAGWSRYIPNGEKYGFDSAEILSESSQEMESTIHCPQCQWEAPAEEAVPPVPCPQCGMTLTADDISEEAPIAVPEDGGTEEIPKGRQVIAIFGALNCKRPQHVNSQSQYHYFAIEEEIHYAVLRAANEDKADEIKPGMGFGAEDVFERNARLSIAENAKGTQASGAKQANLVTHAHIWFRPTAFWMCKDKADRKDLLELFPRGVHVEFAGSTYCKSSAESMDDAIVTCHAMPGRGQHRPGIGTSEMSVQDRYNTLSNIAMETYEYGIPITYRDEQTFNQDADEDQRAAPGLEVGILLPPGQDIRQKIMQVRADSVSPDMAKHAADLANETTQQMTGTYPALTGAAEGQPETLGQQSMQRDQAMGRMGVFYVNLKQFHADLMTISCRSFEGHTDGEVRIPVLGPSGDFESESVDVTALEGEAEAYPEGDENFPELWNQQRATMMQVMDSPFGPKLADEPSNVELLVKLIGIRDMKAPGVDAIRKQLKEIAELTAIPKGDGLLAGIAPMVEVDSDDFHDIEAKTCQHWMSSEAGQKLKRSNPAGWAAVKEHRAQHLQAIPPPPAPVEQPKESVSISSKDMPPEAIAQFLEKKYGIKVTAQDFIDGVMLEKASKPAPKPMPGQPHPDGTHQPPAAGAQ